MHASRLLGTISLSMLPLMLLACGQSGSTHPASTRATTDAASPVAQNTSTGVAQAQRVTLPHGWTLVIYTAAIPYAYRAGIAELKVSAGCQPGERMVGSGYAATDVFEYDARITSSYPADDHTWVASGGTQAGIQLDVYCLHGDHLPTVVIASASSGMVACPADSVLLAAGFGQMAADTTERSTYALCATTGVEAGITATSPVTFDSNSQGYMPVHASVSCPAGQIAFGGGTTGIGNFASGASADFTSWDITGGGQSSGTVYADCVRLL